MAGEERSNGKTRSGSDRERIKNITHEVHPEYEAPRKKTEDRRQKAERSSVKRVNGDGKKTGRSDRSEGVSIDRKVVAAERRRAEERRRRIRRKRRRKQLFRILAACFVVAALGLTVFVVKNYNSGSRHDSKGINAYEDGDYTSAVREFKEAISYDGQNADYYIHLGMAYIEQKAYDEALGYFNQAENCAENSEQKALLNRGRGIASLYQGNYEAAVSWFDLALEMEQLSSDIEVDTLYYKAEAEKKAGNYTAAVDSYGRIIALSDDAGARMLRGMAYMTLEDYAAAETDLYAAIQKSRKSYSIYRTLYTALEAQGKTEEAQSVLSEALELSGSSGEDYFNRGMIYIDLGDDVNAMEMLNKSYDKGYKAALLGMGEAAIGQEDYETALDYYETFFSESSLSNLDTTLVAKAYNQYAVCLLAVGDYETAVQACQNGLSYNDREADASLSLNLISAYEHLAQWENAYNTAKAYADKYPDDEQGMKEYYFLESRVAQ